MKRFDISVDNGEIAVSVNDIEPYTNDYERLVKAIAGIARKEFGHRQVRIDVSMIIDGIDVYD